MYSQVVDISLFCQGNGIIQILCILTINGNRQKMGQIQPAIPVCIQHMIRYTFCLSQHLIRKFTGDPKAFHNSQDVCPWCFHTPQVFDHLTFRAFVLCAVICDLNNHLISIPDALGILLWNKDIFGKSGIITENKAIIPVILIRTYNLGGTTLQDLHNSAFPAFSFLRLPGHNYHYPVLVHSCSCIFLRDKNILFQFFCFYKAKAFAMPDKCPFIPGHINKICLEMIFCLSFFNPGFFFSAVPFFYSL